jgi:hypothetical protein
MPKGEFWKTRRSTSSSMPKGEGAERQFVRFTRLQRVLHVCMIVSFINPGDDRLDPEVLLHKMGRHRFSSARRIRKRGLHSPQRRRGHVRSFHYPSGGPVQAEEKRTQHLALARARTGQHGPQPKRFDRTDRHREVVCRLGARPPTAAGPTGRSSTTLPCSGESQSSDRPVSRCGSRCSSRASFPGSFLNVATIVHSDEALLATGFIFTVHFFNTHLRPEKFPMDITVFTGRMPLEELKRDKPREYEALVAAGKLEENMGEAYQPDRDPHHSSLRLGGAGGGIQHCAVDYLCRVIRVPIVLVERRASPPGPDRWYARL